MVVLWNGLKRGREGKGYGMAVAVVVEAPRRNDYHKISLLTPPCHFPSPIHYYYP